MLWFTGGVSCVWLKNEKHCKHGFQYLESPLPICGVLERKRMAGRDDLLASISTLAPRKTLRTEVRVASSQNVGHG